MHFEIQSTFKMEKEERIIRRWLIFFIAALAVSGFTAIPLETELNFISGFFSIDSDIGRWLDKVYQGLHDTNKGYPFLSYGYDWLAFAHFVLAILFIGPLRDPVRNKWVIQFGIISCILIIPFALTAGHYRGIPVGWRFIDCSFGGIGIVPLLICLNKINKLENIHSESNDSKTND
jgi:hypothetical protein